jgi:predicted O-methyltransferase YrrM
MSKSYAELRVEAEQGTYLYPSVPILEDLTQLVAAPSQSGHADLYYQDADILGSTCCTQAEACLLHWAAHQLPGSTPILEIGSYVGWSTAHLAWGGQRVVCIEPFLEHGRIIDSQLPTRPSVAARERFIENMSVLGLLGFITLIEGCSPEAIPPVPGGYALAFVDGWHQDGQPRRDVEAVAPLLAVAGAMVLHDLWLPDVQDAARWLIGEGWQLTILDTANYLTFAWQTEPPWWSRVWQLACAPAFYHAGAARNRTRCGITALDELQERMSGRHEASI